MTTNSQDRATSEQADFLQTLRTHRDFLRFTLRDLSDEQAAQRTTVSELCLGGLITHVAAVESNWTDFILNGPTDRSSHDQQAGDWAAGFHMEPGEHVSALLDHYDTVATRTDDVVSGLPDLDQSHPLPEAPWFEAGATWSARRVLLHIIAETAQHAGHADIIRESIDGSKTMG